MLELSNVHARKIHLRRASSIGVGVGVGKDSVNDMHDAVRQEDVGLNNQSRDVVQGDILTCAVDGE